MKPLLLCCTLPLLLTAAACSREDQMLEKPRRYQSSAMAASHRSTDKSRFRNEHSPIGLGLDLNSRNPYKFRTVNAPKKYKFSHPKGY